MRALRKRLRSRWLPACLVLACVPVVAAGAPSSRDAGLAQPVNHFQCYRVDPGSPFKPRTIAVTTQFGAAKLTVGQWSVLCAPVRKNGSLVMNPAAHLACYPVPPSGFKPRNVFVTNQFETAAPLVVVAPASLCLPSGKSIVPAPPPGLVKGLDNYECFSVKPRGTPQVKPVALLDQFGKAVATIGAATFLCAPAHLSNAPVYNRVTHLVCYLVVSRQRVFKHVTIRNVFGVATAAVFARQTLCLPSTKRLG